VRSLRVVLLALSLAACATPQLGEPGERAEFELAGRIAMTYRNDAGSANVAWRHGVRSDEMLLTTPFGQGIARIARSDGEVTLTAQDGRQYRAPDAESLTEQVLGFRLPLVGLADWVRGRAAAKPAPEPTAERRDANGRFAELEQSGWKIRYLEYSGALPSRLALSYPGLELRLAITEWK
jgi:outer membrane lipoprotein LolB